MRETHGGGVARDVDDAGLDGVLAGAGDGRRAGVAERGAAATPSIFHSTEATPEPGATSVPWTVTLSERLRQPRGRGGRACRPAGSCRS